MIKIFTNLSKNFVLFTVITLKDYLKNPISTIISCVEDINKLTLAMSKNSYEAAVLKGFLTKKDAFINKLTQLIDPQKVITNRRLLNEYFAESKQVNLLLKQLLSLGKLKTCRKRHVGLPNPVSTMMGILKKKPE